MSSTQGMANGLAERHAEQRKGKRLLRQAVWKLGNPHKAGVLYGPAVFENPYQTLLYSAFPTRVSPASVQRAPLYRRLGLAKVFHLHWDEFNLTPDPDIPTQPDYCTPLRQFQNMGGKLMWTVHNARAHSGMDAQHSALFDAGRQFLCQNADLIHVHNTTARDLLITAYNANRDKIAVIPHPSYLGWYPSAAHAITPQETAAFVAFGTFRANKGLELIIEGFRRISNPDQVAELHVAGRDAGQGDYTGLEALELRISDGFIPDADLPTLFGSADFCVFGFKDILTSGSLMLPLGFGCVPIAPDLPTLREALPEALHPFLYAPGEAQALAAIIERVATMPAAQRGALRQVAFDHAQDLTPARISGQLYTRLEGL